MNGIQWIVMKMKNASVFPLDIYIYIYEIVNEIVAQFKFTAVWLYRTRSYQKHKTQEKCCGKVNLSIRQKADEKNTTHFNNERTNFQQRLFVRIYT